jgi:hypothetical protein
MRQFFFCSVFFTGLFWVIDVVALEGRTSAEAWQEAAPFIQKFNSTIQVQIERIWR